ncbi:MAG: response regulator transcription factor [Bacteroidetes bacterium]|jgi:DNA-binding NarL/FixJ family response regulator|nr:response regulator transcription factor [Bacteroidota bacterium]
MNIRIAIVDDKQQNRSTLRDGLGASESLQIVMLAKNGKDFLDRMKLLNAEERPQVVLMDIEMPEMDGISAVTAAKILYPDVNFLMLTIFDDEDKIFEAIRCGANGYLLKDEKVEVIEDFIRQIMEVGGVPMSPSIARKAMNMLARSSPVNSTENTGAAGETELSERELEVLRLLVQGHDYKIIADKLFLSAHTVRKHIANIYSKLQVSSKAQAINLVHKKKWFDI